MSAIWTHLIAVLVGALPAGLAGLLIGRKHPVVATTAATLSTDAQAAIQKIVTEAVAAAKKV